MRMTLISFAAAASALAVAAPAAAQWRSPQPAPQGYAYGHNNNYGQFRSLQVRVDNVQRRIARLDNRHRITEREARRLREDARELERRLYRSARNGLSWREAQAIEQRLQRLEWRLQRDARDGRRYSGNSVDRDRDGRIDRYEDDRGRRRD